nr:MAG TPA: hypothetical protein [Caudoviricetes sp.]
MKNRSQYRYVCLSKYTALLSLYSCTAYWRCCKDKSIINIKYEVCRKNFRIKYKQQF